jgi:hypothetical protein
MKYLEKFYNYISESKDIDKSELEDMLIPIKDLGFNFNITEGILVGINPDDKNHGKKYLSIFIPLNKLKTTNIITNYQTQNIDDNDFWQLLGEIISLRDRMLDTGLTNCVIDFSNKRVNSTPYISIVLIGDSEHNQDYMKLVEFHKRMKSKLDSMRSDFSYGTSITMVDDHILIKSDDYSYTDRKFNNLLNRSLEGSNLSLSDFNIEKNIEDGRYAKDWLIKITIKK